MFPFLLSLSFRLLRVPPKYLPSFSFWEVFELLRSQVLFLVPLKILPFGLSKFRYFKLLALWSVANQYLRKMEGYSRKDNGCHQFLDLKQKEKNFRVEETRHGISEEQKLELSLAPPGGDWSPTDNTRDHESLLSFGYYSNNLCPQNSTSRLPWQHRTGYSVHLQSAHSGGGAQMHTVTKEASQPSGSRVHRELQNSEKNVLSPTSANTAVPNRSSAHKGTAAPSPMVGWPPIRSFRKNLATGSSSKFTTESAKGCNPNNMENCQKNLFVKINMDGIPIGRKIDLKAYDSYEKLSNAVDDLFKDLIAAQNKSSTCGIKGEEQGRKVIGGLMDSNRKYTLVYEDNEGDRMLVGDVPWPMFASTVKRLRVLKSSELSKLSSGGKQGKLSLHK